MIKSKQDSLTIDEFKLVYPPRFTGDIILSTDKVMYEGKLKGHPTFKFE
jgi:hypothetical protein